MCEGNLGKVSLENIVNWGNSFLFEYQTPRVVTMMNKRIGVTYRIVQFLLLIYLVGYVFVYTKSYQQFDTADSSVVVKVKGMLQRNNSGVLEIWDSNDFVVPSQESNAFFIATNLLFTSNQSQGICHEDRNVGRKGIWCQNDSNCSNGKPTPYGNGIATGKCVQATGTCEIMAWCPTEIDNAPEVPALSGFESITVLVKNHIVFPKFNVKRRNILDKFPKEYLHTCKYHPVKDPLCPIFFINDIVSFSGEKLDSMAIKGGIIGFNIAWNCDLDWDEENCVPHYSFRRLDNKNDMIAKGWNFRGTVYYYDVNGVARRNLIKYWGIRFVFLVDGRAGKFWIVNFIMHIGSSLGLFGIAAIICELMLFTFCRGSPVLREQKFKDLEKVKKRRLSSFPGSNISPFSRPDNCSSDSEEDRQLENTPLAKVYAAYDMNKDLRIYLFSHDNNDDVTNEVVSWV